MKRILHKAGVEPEPVVHKPIAIPNIGSLDKLDLPVSVPQAKQFVREEVLDASEGLDNLTQLALEKAKEILELPLIPGDDSFNAILKNQVSTLGTILTTQARVDEGRFKKKSIDKIGELIELIRGEEAKIVPVRILN